MKLTILSRYDRLGASSRLRTLLYRPYMEAVGFEVSIYPFFDDAYLRALYEGKGRGIGAGRYYRRRIRDLVRGRQSDLILLEKEALPWVPWLVENRLLPRRIPLVVDYDDAIFHRYDRHDSAVVRGLLGDKIDAVMARADLVTAGNDYLGDRARSAGAKRVEVVPTVVDSEAYAVRTLPPQSEDKAVTFGWIGAPGTWKECVSPILSVLLSSAQDNAAIFRAVGAGVHDSDEPGLEVFDWTEAGEVSLIQGMDIGIMPLPDTPWMRGKCGYKLIQYMACGLPVIASPVGVNSQIVEHGVNGFLAGTEAEWRNALQTLIADPLLREKMGAAGREKVGSWYSLQVQGPRLADMLKSVVPRHIASA